MVLSYRKHNWEALLVDLYDRLKRTKMSLCFEILPRLNTQQFSNKKFLLCLQGKGRNKYFYCRPLLQLNIFRKVTEKWRSTALSIYKIYLSGKQTDSLPTQVLLSISSAPMQLTEALNGFPATWVSTGSQITSTSCKSTNLKKIPLFWALRMQCMHVHTLYTFHSHYLQC